MPHRSIHYEVLPPDELAADTLPAYLEGILKGVGPVLAKQMVDDLGPQVLDILDADDAVVQLMKVKGIGRKKAQAIKAGWDHSACKATCY